MTLDFLIIGTMKSGTSTLSRYLEAHPEIGIPKKEIHFFDRNKDKGLDWYFQTLEKAGEDGCLIHGEKTPFYAWQDSIAEELYSINPKLKLIWLFRDPIERLISQYKHNVYSGREWKSLTSAIALEKERIADDLQLGYVFGSKYEEQIERYLRYFPKEQMKFYSFEFFVRNQERVVGEVFEFLGVDDIPFQKIAAANEGGNVKNRFVNFFTAKFFGKKNRVYNSIFTWNQSARKRNNLLTSRQIEKMKQSFDQTEMYIRKNCGVDTSYWKNWK